MTNEEFIELKNKFNLVSTIKYDIDELKKEINNLNLINKDELKNMYFKSLSGYVLDEKEWMVQKYFFERIINFALEFRKKKLIQLQQQLQEL